MARYEIPRGSRISGASPTSSASEKHDKSLKSSSKTESLERSSNILSKKINNESTLERPESKKLTPLEIPSKEHSENKSAKNIPKISVPKSRISISYSKDTNSLTYFTRMIGKELKYRFTDESYPLEHSKEIRSNFQTLEKKWESLFARMCQIATDLDRRYLKENYFGYLRKVKCDFLSILRKYILLGPDALVKREDVEFLDLYEGAILDTKEECFRDSINNYLRSIPNTFARIKFLRDSRDRVNSEIESKVHEYDVSKKKLLECRKKIEKLRKKISSIQSKIVKLKKKSDTSEVERKQAELDVLITKLDIESNNLKDLEKKWNFARMDAETYFDAIEEYGKNIRIEYRRLEGRLKLDCSSLPDL